MKCVICGVDTTDCGVVDHLERFCSWECAEKKYPTKPTKRCPTCQKAAANYIATREWTTEPPTEPGWYWAIDRADRGPQCVQVVMRNNALCVLIVDYEDDGELDKFTHWMRIEAPEVPK